MAHKLQLSKQRLHTIINRTSKKQETALMRAVRRVRKTLEQEYKGLRFDQTPQLQLGAVIAQLKYAFPDVGFCTCFESSSMRPDGGILSIEDGSGRKYPVLISEKKNQGTNDFRAKQGKSKQAKGNAIERLGKNVIGFRASLLEDSSIVDRVKTIAMFGTLNEIHLHNEGPNGVFNRGTYYFRVPEWTEDEMYALSLEVARRSILYYFSKYGERTFAG